MTLHALNRRLDASLQQFEALDLAQRNSDIGPCAPYDPKKPWYPGLSLYNREDSLDDIPDEGAAIVKYKITNRSSSESNGKKRYSISMDLLSFDPQDSKKKDAKKKAAGEAVEMSNAECGMTNFSAFSDRPRNGDGQFVGNATGGADPVTMRQAYGDKPERSKLLAPGAVAGTLAAGGLLGTKTGRVMAARSVKGASRMLRGAVAAVDRKFPGSSKKGPRQAKTGEMWPRMGSKAPQTRREGLGEVIYRQGQSGKRRPVSGD